MPTPSAAAASAIRTHPQVGTLSESFSLPDAGTVSVFVTVVVAPGVVTVFVGPAPLALVPVLPPADWTVVLTLVAAVETACFNAPDPLDPHALTAQAINAAAISASAIMAPALVAAAIKADSASRSAMRATPT